MTMLPRTWPPRLVIGLAVVIAVLIGTLGHQPRSSAATEFGDRSPIASPSAGATPGSASGSSPTSTSTSRLDDGPPGRVERGADEAGRGQPDRPGGHLGLADGAAPPGANHGALDEADGLVPDGASVFDDDTPAVANLDPSLLRALRRAAVDAAKGGVEFQVNSGWRSPAYQEQLLREAIAKYGSEEEAARWVATVTTSPHVSGDAVDIGPSDATAWLSKHGAHYGLCQIYRNESWHYELRAEATSGGCPPMYADPTHDPRMRQ